jgi:very-short-patch-repair endonuclease
MSDYFEKLKVIRARYKDVELPCNPYSIYDWHKIWTPIERNTWADIRAIGLPFYPEYPAGKYFIDFADPFKGIGIEVDGREYHQDKEKDEIRQTELEKMGWIIYRIEGWMTLKDREEFYKEFEDEQDYCDDDVYQEKLADINSRFKVECSEGILRNIREKFYKKICLIS